MNEVQEKELEILTEIIKVLDKNSLRYFMAGGSLIGTIRHKGFIPWDDDIDIVMPRKDYEVFRTKTYKELPSYLEKLDCDNSEHNYFVFTKIHNINTTYVGEYCKNYKDWYTGVFVDIFPIDGMPIKRKRFINRVYLLNTLNEIRRVEKTNNNNNISFIESSIRKVMHGILRVFKYNYFSSKLLNYVSNNEFDESEDFVFVTGSYWRNEVNRAIFHKNLFLQYKMLPFENIMVKVPIGYDEILSNQYGNYMMIPSKENQKPHAIYLTDLNTPVSFYKKDVKND